MGSGDKMVNLYYFDACMCMCMHVNSSHCAVEMDILPNPTCHPFISAPPGPPQLKSLDTPLGETPVRVRKKVSSVCLFSF